MSALPTIKNLLVAGIGRQGINSLARVIALVSREAGFSCQYTVHKGGAQSLGSVYAEMRFTKGELPPLGPTIPAGRLHCLVALDPWEGLRHLSLANEQTICFIERQTMPLFSDRDAPDEGTTPADPLALLARLPLKVALRDYRAEANRRHGTVAMANFLAGYDCLPFLEVTDTDLYERIFFANISSATKRSLP